MNSLKLFLTEEWRIHTTFFSKKYFILFPIIILAISFIFTTFIPQFIGQRDMYIFCHYLFLIFGLIIGAFGLGARDALNRRFGETSFLAYSSRTLPISIKKIFIIFALKDMIYYTSFLIVPFMSSLFLSEIINPYSLSKTLFSFVTIPLSFILGISISFFLSTIYYELKEIIQVALIVLILGLFIFSRKILTEKVYETVLPTVQLFLNPNLITLVITIAGIIIFLLLAMSLFRYEHKTKEANYKTLLKNYGTKTIRVFMKKDLIDLHRSQGSFGKVLFSLLIPVIIIEVMITFLFRIITMTANGEFLLLSVVIGVASSSVYNWLTEFDLYEKYSFLPITDRTILLSKIILTSIIGTGSGAIMVLTSKLFLNSDLILIPLGIAVFIITFFYALSTTTLLTGLNPDILMFDSKRFLLYILIQSPVVIFLMYSSFVYPNINAGMLIFSLASIAVIALVIMRTSLKNPQKIRIE